MPNEEWDNYFINWFMVNPVSGELEQKNVIYWSLDSEVDDWINNRIATNKLSIHIFHIFIKENQMIEFRMYNPITKKITTFEHDGLKNIFPMTLQELTIISLVHSNTIPVSIKNGDKKTLEKMGVIFGSTEGRFGIHMYNVMFPDPDPEDSNKWQYRRSVVVTEPSIFLINDQNKNVARVTIGPYKDLQKREASVELC